MNIIAWQKSQNLAADIYPLFTNSKDFGFKDQICRASVSISSNVAEGFDRRSDREFRQFLYIALGSCSEVRSLLYLAFRFAYITNQQKLELIEKSYEVSRLIRGLIKSLD